MRQVVILYLFLIYKTSKNLVLSRFFAFKLVVGIGFMLITFRTTDCDFWIIKWNKLSLLRIHVICMKLFSISQRGKYFYRNYDINNGKSDFHKINQTLRIQSNVLLKEFESKFKCLNEIIQLLQTQNVNGRIEEVKVLLLAKITKENK